MPTLTDGPITLQFTLNLPSELQARLRAEASERGIPLESLVGSLLKYLAFTMLPTIARDEIQHALGLYPLTDPVALRALPREERNRILAAQAADAAPLYEADLALPPAERELTAFSVLLGDRIYDYTP